MKKHKFSFKYLLFGAFISSHALFAVTVDQAKKIAAKAEKHALSKNFKMCIAIVNSEGNLLYFQRGDGCQVGSIETAQKKAYAANAYKRPTRAFVDGIAAGHVELLTLPNVVALAGGVPITSDGAHDGAIGVSGGSADEDEEVALAGLAPDEAR
jgi:glc operon protein GlcG